MNGENDENEIGKLT